MVKYVIRIRKEMNRMEKKKESVLPIIVFLITLGIGVIMLLKFILFS
jgi:hypothetical protein